MSDNGSYRCAICNEFLEESGVLACASCLLENAARVEDVTISLQRVTISCRFEEYGCKQTIRFGEIEKHEAVCQFKPVSCFIFGRCTWKGSSKDILKHLSEKHPHHVSESCEVKIDFKNKIEKKVALFQKNGVLTIVSYEFNLDKLEFEYSICYVSQHNYQISYEMEVTNVNNKNCRFLIKCDKHRAYQADWLKTKSVLNLNHLLPPLKDDLISISVRAGVAINYAELLKLQCKICCAYITLPIFKKNNGLVCWFCAKKHNLLPVDDKYLEGKITELSYPCRWKHCTALANHDEIYQHEKTCSYRKIVCPEWNCRDTFDIKDVHRHFHTMHNNYKHISNQQTTIYWYHLRQFSFKERYFYIVQTDGVFVIKYDISKSEFWYDIMPDDDLSCVSTFMKSNCCKRIEKLLPNTKFNVQDVFRCCAHTEFPLDGKISFNIFVGNLKDDGSSINVPVKVLYQC